MNLGWMEKITKRNKKKNEKAFRDLGYGFNEVQSTFIQDF